jgi:hypothetical protein
MRLGQIVSARIPDFVGFDWDFGSDFGVDCPGCSSRRNLGDFSIRDCKYWSRGCFAVSNCC